MKKNTWTIIVSISIVISLLVGWQTLYGHFAKTTQLNELETNIKNDTKNKILLVEAESVKTFQGIQNQQIILNQSVILQMYQNHKEYLDKENIRLKRELKRYPNDIDVKDELEFNKLQRIQIQDKINKQLQIK